MSTPTSGRVSRMATRVRAASKRQPGPELSEKALRLVLRDLLFDGEGVPEWRRSAACAAPTTDRDIFFPPDGWASDLAVSTAKQVCQSCPVRAVCLADALSWEDPNQRHGVLGGLTPTERAAVAEVGGAA